MTNGLQSTREPLGRFESLLLDELKLLVREQPERRAATPSWRTRRWIVVVAAVLALLVAAGIAAGLSHVFGGSAHKLQLARTLDAGGHIGPEVASSGRFGLYASADGRDVELRYAESAQSWWSAVTRFPASRLVVRMDSDTPRWPSPEWCRRMRPEPSCGT